MPTTANARFSEVNSYQCLFNLQHDTSVSMPILIHPLPSSFVLYSLFFFPHTFFLHTKFL